MNITVLGAAGNVGSRVTAEALARGHHVTGVVRDPTTADHLPDGVDVRIGDASNIDDVTEFSAGQDVVITATRPRPGNEDELARTTKALLAGIVRPGPRLLIVGGAATLTVPDGNSLTVLDHPGFLPSSARAIARASAEQLELCRTEPDLDWVYLSPPAQLEPGPRTGNYRIGTDELLVDTHGNSTISMADLAVALLDEAEHPAHHQTRFTVAH